MNIIESIDRDVFNAIDHDERYRSEIMSEVEALSSYDTCEAGTDGHEECEYDDPCHTLEDWPSLRDVGDVVATWLRDNVEEHVTHPVLSTLILDLMDLENVAVLETLGRTWYPDDALQTMIAAGRIEA